MTTSFVNIGLQRTCLLSHAFQTTHWRCVSKVILHAANLHILPKSLGSTVQSGLLVTCSRHLYSSAQRESRYCCPVEDLGFKGLYMGAQIYINKHSSAAKVSFGAQNINLEHDAPQARRNNHAHAGTWITQGTATQWSIFSEFLKILKKTLTHFFYSEFSSILAKKMTRNVR